MSLALRTGIAALLTMTLAACMGGAADDQDDSSTATTSAADSTLPPGADDAAARLAASPRHGEWVMIPTGPSDSVRAWVVYPERSTKAPVVVVIHEIFGLSTWVRAVTDQLAADGFIAIAPDLLSGLYTWKSISDTLSADSARSLIRSLDPDDVQRRLSAVGKYGMSLPAATQHYGIVGFCWGGSTSFAHAVAAPDLDAAVVYYGTSPKADDLAKIHAPVLGLYGQNDARVTSTVAPADSVMKQLGKTYEHFIFDGAGHGFLRAQNGQNGANRAAAEQAWPKTIAWFKKYLGE